MTRILYGVHGEGMGHAVRSKVIIDYLSKKHNLVIVSGNRTYEFLSRHFKNVYEIYGFNFIYEGNRVVRSKTFFHSMYRLFKGFFPNFKTIYKLIHDFKPRVVISDFEPFSVLFALLYRIPIISVEYLNMSWITSTRGLPKKYLFDYYLSRIVVRLFILYSNYHLITSFSDVEMKYKKNIYIFPPILRNDILNREAEEENYILVYQTSSSNKKLYYVMANMDENFIAYGFDVDKKIKNITYKKFDEKGFIRDLANCKAIIANGGFSLISEAIHLGKPILCIPLKKQCEQILNAIQLEGMGYGKFHETLNKNILDGFLMNVDGYKKNLEMYKRKDNSRFFNELDSLIKKLTK